MSTLFFRAPWGTTTIAVTGLTCILFVGIVLLALWIGQRVNTSVMVLLVVLPVAVLLVAAIFSVRGYAIAGQTLQIQRLGWITSISLTELQSAEVIPSAMRNSLRTWGNGGLFGFVGRFRNAELGPYQAFATDLERTVVLTFPTRKIVLSPENPDEFVASVSQRQTDA